MTLKPLPDHQDVLIVHGTSVRKNLPTLRAHLASLEWQSLPPRHRLYPIYVSDFTPDQQDARAFLDQWVKKRGGEVLRSVQPPTADFAEGPGLDSHQWTTSSMARVGQNKNLILQRALALGADYVFLADADLILDRTTVASLLAAEKPITTAVYWTRWSKRGTETRRVHCAPQVWLRHPYQLDGRGLEEGEFRQRLVDRGLLRVWGFGACTLIQRRVIESGISFEYLPDVPLQGLMAGEDRHFCIRCERQHIDAYADAWPDIFHIYHDEDQQQIGAMVERLGGIRRATPSVGDLVNLRLRALEPLAVGPGRFQHVQPQIIRGRLGQIKLLPDLEEAVATMTVGETRIVRVHVPLQYPMAYLRNRIRLVEVTLVDTKPMGFAPTLDEEMLIGRSGAHLDMTALSRDQHESLQEVAHG